MSNIQQASHSYQPCKDGSILGNLLGQKKIIKITCVALQMEFILSTFII